MDLDRYIQGRLTGRERRPANRGPESGYRRDGRSPVPLLLAASGIDPTAVFQPLPRKAVDAFAGRPERPTPRFVLLLPMQADNLDQAVNLAVLLGRSLRYMPELEARDELVMDLHTETLHEAFCDRILPGDQECSRPGGHPGSCEAL